MRKFRLLLAAGLIAVLVAACSSTTDPAPQPEDPEPEPPPEPGLVMLHFGG